MRPRRKRAEVADCASRTHGLFASFPGYLRTTDELHAFCGKGGCACPTRSGLLCSSCDGVVKGTVGLSRIAKGRTVTCDECYFGCNLLCALALQEACPTFRPNTPEGLRPPRQLAFVFRQERRERAAWAFPSAQEQAALHE